MKTICACATPPGNGGISIVRISGEHAKYISEKVFSVKDLQPRMMTLGDIVTQDGVLDRCLAVYFVSPNSFTGEDVVEFHCHGGQVVTSALIRLLMENGCCVAQPGEFTKRAFLNGKMDISEAQAVGELITAMSERSAQASAKKLRGELREKIERMQDELTDVLAALEVFIEYPEEDLGNEHIVGGIADMVSELEALEGSFHTGRLLKEGCNLAIVGRPNVGKSSLLNSFLGTKRAIVTDIPGTTRDVISECYVLDGLPLVLTDTAGIRESADEVERLGIGFSKKAIEDCDIALLVLDSSSELSAEDEDIFYSIEGKPCIVVLNKSDLAIKLSEELVTRSFGVSPVVVSAANSTGLEELKRAIFSACEYDAAVTESVMLNNARQREATVNAISSLRDAVSAIEQGFESELVATDIKDAWHSLGLITGRTLDEDIVDRIFENFCLGK